MGVTYNGSSIEVSATTPASNDQTGFEALTFVGGACALHEIPAIARTWNEVEENLVCQTTSYKRKGKAMYDAVTFKLSDIPTDAAQAIYDQLEASISQVGSFKMNLEGIGVVYFTAQVKKFALADGGNADAIHTRSVELLIQSEPIKVLN